MRAWEPVFASLKRESPNALKLMKVISFYKPSWIHYSLAKEVLPFIWANSTIDQNLATLANYGLLHQHPEVRTVCIPPAVKDMILKYHVNTSVHGHIAKKALFKFLERAHLYEGIMPGLDDVEALQEIFEQNPAKFSEKDRIELAEQPPKRAKSLQEHPKGSAELQEKLLAKALPVLHQTLGDSDEMQYAYAALAMVIVHFEDW